MALLDFALCTFLKMPLFCFLLLVFPALSTLRHTVGMTRTKRYHQAAGIFVALVTKAANHKYRGLYLCERREG